MGRINNKLISRSVFGEVFMGSSFTSIMNKSRWIVDKIWWLTSRNYATKSENQTPLALKRQTGVSGFRFRFDFYGLVLDHTRHLFGLGDPIRNLFFRRELADEAFLHVNLNQFRMQIFRLAHCQFGNGVDAGFFQ